MSLWEADASTSRVGFQIVPLVVSATGGACYFRALYICPIENATFICYIVDMKCDIYPLTVCISALK